MRTENGNVVIVCLETASSTNERKMTAVKRIFSFSVSLSLSAF